MDRTATAIRFINHGNGNEAVYFAGEKVIEAPVISGRKAKEAIQGAGAPLVVKIYDIVIDRVEPGIFTDKIEDLGDALFEMEGGSNPWKRK